MTISDEERNRCIGPVEGFPMAEAIDTFGTALDEPPSRIVFEGRFDWPVYVPQRTCRLEECRGGFRCSACRAGVSRMGEGPYCSVCGAMIEGRGEEG